MTKLWNNLNVSTLSDFKEQLKKELKPSRYKHFSKGNKIGNSLLTRLRLNRSELNLHRFDINLHDSPECACHAKFESSIHFLMDCLFILVSVRYYFPWLNITYQIFSN